MTTLPPDYTVNAISLVSGTDGKLLHVSLYTGRAEIRRKFQFAVQTGQNQLCITGLPNVIHEDSLRVQGYGDATIHDVSLSTTPPLPVVATSPALEELISKKNLVKSAINRSQTSSHALEKYMSSMTVHDVPLGQIGTFLESYNLHGSKLDEELAGLEKEEAKLYKEIMAEKTRIAKEQASKSNGGLLGMQVSIGLFAETEGEIELELAYAVSSANWEAVYDIRVNLESKDHPLTLVYKAAIAQNTGEDWTNVPLTLETATPTFGVQIPALQSLKLSVKKPPPHYPGPTIIHLPPSYPQPVMAPSQPVIIQSRSRSRSRTPPRVIIARSRSSSRSFRRMRVRGRSRSQSPVYVPPAPSRALGTLGLIATSKGDGRFNHSVFQVPGLISVPCDGMAHNVTIVELNEELDTKLLWVSVPKLDTRVHLKAKIKNASEYALIPGKASVYVDGTFIARIDVPAAGPDESFDCSLGLDSSITVTYHPLSSKITHRTPFTGFTGINSLSTLGTTKTTSTFYSQRITVHNTKRLLDRVPVSEDSKIVVKVVKPAELSFSNLSKAQNQNQAVSVPSSQMATVKAKSPSGQGSKKREENEKTDDTTSFTSSKADANSSVGIGKRFSLSKPFGSSRKSAQSENNTTVGEIEESFPSSSAQAQVSDKPATTVARIVAQWDSADGEMESTHGNANVTDDNSDAIVVPEGGGSGNDGKMNWLLYDLPSHRDVSAASNVEIYEQEA
ncbi:hypothetical protein BT96DRAFT_913285 [Gymnopus androsaceus JB14]|uniref:Mucoidy inhibitor A n=1 Tax=Gymnopus androsaceus JB14 TaxID=1447944 RepID=A0A6A4IGP0_9AGAR|nr:hypothetical protein BT96DRAFT_913285 [Gymnopus androsaceus JB14]